MILLSWRMRSSTRPRQLIEMHPQTRRASNHLEATKHMQRERHLVPIRLMNMPLWLYFRSVSSSEKLVKL
jgi:hypothetical protein